MQPSRDSAEDVSALREKPIPSLDSARLQCGGYRQWPIDYEHPLHEQGWSDVRAHSIAGENFYFQVDNPPYFHRIPHSISDLLLRHRLVEMLQRINSRLMPAGLEIYVFDAYRPVEVQNYFHDHWFPSYLRKINPALKEEELRSEVEKYWAKGAPSSQEIDPASPPPHATGGAVDLTIRRRRDLLHLNMGCIFDDGNEVAHTDHFESQSRLRILNISETEALKNRRLLYWVMREEGFANYPGEWWHYSWGDQMWAKLSGAAKAVYSFMTCDMQDKGMS